MWANFISHCDEGAIFHNFRKKIISHSALPNISLERIVDLCYNKRKEGGVLWRIYKLFYI